MFVFLTIESRKDDTARCHENAIAYQIESYLKKLDSTMMLPGNSNTNWWSFKNSRQLFHEANIEALLIAIMMEERKNIL